MSHAGPSRPGIFSWISIIGAVAVVVVLLVLSLGQAGGQEGGHASSPGAPPWWGLGVMPFVGLLACIAVLPLMPATQHWWESNVNRLGVSMFFSGLTLIYYAFARGAELGVNTPWKFFWATGGLSSFLDNAPTYVVFFETAKVLPPDGTATLALGGGGEINIGFLVAISLGSVFMGSMTYIGNGPNFMVKSIAEQTGIRMPSFFGYLFKYSVPILIPVFILITVLFLMPWSPLA